MQGSVSKIPEQKFIDEATYIVDASSYIFRAYYGLQTELKAPDGTPTHATYAFVGMIRSLMSIYKTKKLLLVWDRKEPSFRRDLYEKYKANRSAPPEDLSLQIENTQRVMDLWGYAQLSAPGYEADDVIASVVEKGRGPMVIVTADKDLMQLVSDRVWCLDTRKNQWSNATEAKEKFGVEPAQIVDVQAIMGDSVDNIPGAPGVGPKGAAELIQYYGSLAKVLEVAKSRAADLNKKYPDPLSGKRLKSIAENIPLIELSYKLVSLSRDVPYDDILFEKQHPPKIDELLNELNRLGFTRFVSEVTRLAAAGEGSPPSGAPAVADAPAGATQSSFEILPPSGKFTSVTTIAELKEILARHDSRREVAFDTETFGLDLYKPQNLVGFSFAFDEQEAFYAPLRHRDTQNLTGESLELLAGFLNKRTTIFHNGKFDWHQLASDDIRFTGDYHDTILASFLLDVSGSHNLENLSERHLQARPTRFSDVVKKGQNFSDVPLDAATHYAAEDAHLTWRLWQKFAPELKARELWRLYDEVDRPLARVLFDMERTGVKLDIDYLNRLYRDLERERFDAEGRAREILRGDQIVEHETINFASPKQLGKLLFEDLKLPIIKKGKTGPSTDVEVLEELSLQHAFPKVLLEIRELSKLISTYIQPLPELVNAKSLRLHTNFSQTVAQTGRLASSDPNLQNIPIRTERGSRIRRAFIAEPGHQLYSADYSQIELRFLAEVTGDLELTKAFKDGADIHTRTAALIFRKAESEVTPDERRSAKTINFGIIYGQTAFGLAKTLGIPRHEAQRFIDSYFRSYPRLKIWMEEVLKEAREKGNVKTFLGRCRQLENINSKNPMLRNFAERMAINSPLQGTAADLIKLAMIRVHKWIKDSGAPVKLVLQIHDELLLEVKTGYEREFFPQLKQILEDAAVFEPFTGKILQTPLLTDHGAGPNWGELADL